MKKLSFLSLSGFCLLTLVCFAPAASLAATDVQSAITKLEKRIDAQQKLVEKQQRMLVAQAGEIKKQKEMIASLAGVDAKKNDAKKVSTDVASLTEPPLRRTFTAQQRAGAKKAADAPLRASLSDDEISRPQVDALANQGGILSPPGSLSFENTIEYTNTTRNLFAFNGVELAQVVLVGGITASSARHQIVQEAGRFRLGLTNDLEADIHIPFVYRNDALTNSVSPSGTISKSVQGANLGDIDAGLAYQFNKGKQGWPFLIGNLRYKANNADGPFDVSYDSNNFAKRLPTGTGFQTIEASVTAIKVSDPAVLFANLGYVYDVPRNIDRNFNGVNVGYVSPGDAINALIGMGFAVNQDLSFSLGYKHSYVFPTYQKMTQSGTMTNTSSGTSQVGALTFGLSYAFTPETTVNFNLDAGVTNDAPDVHLMFRVPFHLGYLF